MKTDWRFKVGDKVTREVNICQPLLGVKKGTVIRRYQEKASIITFADGETITLGPYDELYEVQWDDGTVKKGYFYYGISPLN